MAPQQANISFFNSLTPSEQTIIGPSPNDSQIWNAGSTSTQVSGGLSGYIAGLKRRTNQLVEDIGGLTNMLQRVPLDKEKPKYMDVVWDSFMNNLEELLDLLSESNDWGSFVRKYGEAQKAHPTYTISKDFKF